MKKRDKKILDDIQMRANAKYGDKLWIDKPKADVILKIIEKALTEKKDMFSEDELKKMKSIRDSHILEGTERVIDDKVLKKMDDYMGKEITKNINEGLLTHPDKDPYFKKIKKLTKKQNGRKD